MMCDYLIMAGGTGGHIFPALAVADELKRAGARIHWLGTAGGMEATLVPKAGLSLSCIDIKGFRGKGWWAKLLMPLQLLRAIYQALWVIRQCNPRLVIGFGGFVAAPGGIAARLAGKKLLIHEQNAVAGTTNRLLAKVAHCVLEAFPHTLKSAIYVGNPVRLALREIKRDVTASTDRPLRLLVLGGSLGALAINQRLPEAISYMDEAHRPEIWHQSGKQKHQALAKDYQAHQLCPRIDEFIDDMAQAYRWADLVICRAGALTVSEVAAVGIPAIFIPLPSAIDNHQFFNAKWLADLQAAFLIEQQQASAASLSALLLRLHHNREELQKMCQQLQQLALPNATEEVALHCQKLSQKGALS